MSNEEKAQIGLAGELRVASELIKKGYNASITFGNAKATDIIILDKNHRYIRVEVKTSRNHRNFVTGYYPKYTTPEKVHPDVWVFFLPNKEGNSDGDKFYILTHKDVGEIQLSVNKGVKTLPGKGCDNIPLKHLLIYAPNSDGDWNLFKDVFKSL